MVWNKRVPRVSYPLAMKRQRHLVLWIASFLATIGNAMAELPTVSTDDGQKPKATSAIRVELNKMLAADAKEITKANQNETKVVIEIPDSAAPVTMSPYIVREAKPPDTIKPQSEIPFVRWLRDGTLHDSVGKTFTTGAKLTFYQTTTPPGGNVKPVSGVRMGISWSW
jgi:hypothetical protein